MTNDKMISREVVHEAMACLQHGCEKIEHCLNQLDEQQVWWRPQDDMNSIGNLMLHLAGNLRQWIVAGVGDAPDTRERQSEFDERGPIPKAQLWERLTDVVQQATTALRAATPEAILSVKRVQGYDVTKLQAMLHSVTHFQGHVQEIICLTRQQLGSRYQMHWTPQTKEEGAVR